MLKPGSRALTLLLAMLSGLGPLSVDLYLPSLPAIGRLLQASVADVQLTISLYLVGYACAQIFYGPLSDRHGRRPVLLATLGLYVLASIACALAFSIETLIAARVLQALGGSGAIVLARTVVRDGFEGAHVGREMARLAAITVLAPLVAPMIGGVLQTAFGWRSNFVALFVIGAVGWIMVWFLLPETLPQRAREPVSVRSMLRSYRNLLGHADFVVHLCIVTCCMCGLFAWISSAAFVLQDIYGLSALVFGLAVAVVQAAFTVVTAVMLARIYVQLAGAGEAQSGVPKSGI